MSSCFHSNVLLRQVRWTALLLAALACRGAQAQIVGSDEPFISSAAARTSIGTTPLRIWHRTQGYGQEASETAFGGRAAWDFVDAVGFIDGQFRISNESRGGANFGGGFRWRTGGLITSDPRIFGVTGWYDGQETLLGNYFNQLGVSFESLGEFLDARLNVNIPLEDAKTGDDLRFTGVAGFTGNFLTQGTFVSADVPLRVVDFEVAPRIYNLNAWFYGGGYQMDGEGISETGVKGGARGYITNDLAIDVGVSDDDLFGTTTSAQVIWTPGRTGAGPTSWIHTLADRMREPVYRNTYIATARTVIAGTANLTDTSGDAIRVVHVDSNATGAGTGDGTAENPLKSLNDVLAFSTQGDIVLVHAESMHTGQFVTLQDEQRFLGEGGGNRHTVTTTEFGQIFLPETMAGAAAGTIPLIQNAPTDAIILAGGNSLVSSFSPIEVSNFQIQGGQRAISSPTGVGGVNINRLAITGTSGNAIDLSPLNETLANSTTRSRFQPTIDDVTFTNVGGDDIHLEDAAANATSTVEAITITDITSTGGGGVGINLIGNKRAATISNVTWNGGATATGAIRIEDAVGNVTINGTNTIASDPGETGFGLAIIDSAGTHTVTGTTITNTGSDSVQVSGGSATLNFTGRIDQNQNAGVVTVSNGHTGSVTFRELTANAGVISATNGTGVRFDNADGTYTFVNKVTLNGGDAGIDVLNDSAGTITFNNGEITSPTGTAVNVVGGSASMSFTGKITQANNASTVAVSGGHTGTLTFNDLGSNPGGISATNGDGLQFNNADGAYVFNGTTTLNGGDAGIDVLGGSSGTFTFANADIDYGNGGNAVAITGSNVQAFTLSGDIDVTNGRPVSITNNTGGSITFNSTIDSSTAAGQGILVDNNANTNVRFAGQTTLNTGAFAGVTLSDNTAGSIRFDNVDVTTTSGDGFVAINTDNLTVQGSGNTITSTSGVGLNLNNVEVGASGVTFQTVNVSAGAGQGITLNNVRGGLVTVNGGTIASNGTAVSITNAANTTLNSMSLSSATGQGVNYVNNTAAASRITLNNNTISGTDLEGVRLEVSGAATLANITVRNNTINNTSDDEGLLLTTSGGSLKTVNLLVEGNSVSNDDVAVPAASFQADGNTTLNATVRGGNVFTAANTGRPFEMASGTGSRVRLLLNGNTASEGTAPGEDFFLIEAVGGNFSVVDVADVETDNTGTVNFSPNEAAFSNDPGGIPTP